MPRIGLVLLLHMICSIHAFDDVRNQGALLNNTDHDGGSWTKFMKEKISENREYRAEKLQSVITHMSEIIRKDEEKQHLLNSSFIASLDRLNFHKLPKERFEFEEIKRRKRSDFNYKRDSVHRSKRRYHPSPPVDTPFTQIQRENNDHDTKRSFIEVRRPLQRNVSAQSLSKMSVVENKTNTIHNDVHEGLLYGMRNLTGSQPANMSANATHTNHYELHQRQQNLNRTTNTTDSKVSAAFSNNTRRDFLPIEPSITYTDEVTPDLTNQRFLQSADSTFRLSPIHEIHFEHDPIIGADQLVNVAQRFTQRPSANAVTRDISVEYHNSNNVASIKDSISTPEQEKTKPLHFDGVVMPREDFVGVGHVGKPQHQAYFQRRPGVFENFIGMSEPQKFVPERRLKFKGSRNTPARFRNVGGSSRMFDSKYAVTRPIARSHIPDNHIQSSVINDYLSFRLKNSEDEYTPNLKSFFKFTGDVDEQSLPFSNASSEIPMKKQVLQNKSQRKTKTEDDFMPLKILTPSDEATENPAERSKMTSPGILIFQLKKSDSDEILNMQKELSGKKRLVIDFSKGSEHAQLLVYPLNDDVASKRSTIPRFVLHTEAVKNVNAKKRMIGSFGINRWVYFGINTGTKRYGVPGGNMSEDDSEKRGNLYYRKAKYKNMLHTTENSNGVVDESKYPKTLAFMSDDPLKQTLRIKGDELEERQHGRMFSAPQSRKPKHHSLLARKTLLHSGKENSEIPARLLQKFQRSKVKKKIEPRKVIDVSGDDDDDDDDDDNDDKDDYQPLVHLQKGKDQLNKKEEVLYQKYIHKKKPSVYSDARDKRDRILRHSDFTNNTGNDARRAAQSLMNESDLRKKENIPSLMDSSKYFQYYIDHPDALQKEARVTLLAKEKESDETGTAKTKIIHKKSNWRETVRKTTDSDDDYSGDSLEDGIKPKTGWKRAHDYRDDEKDEKAEKRYSGTQRALDVLYRSHKFPNEPDSKEVLDRFDAPTRVGYQYGQLIWGWFIAPLDGEYVFYSACDDACDIFMSPDEGKDHIRKIISQNRWSLHNQFDKFPEEQTSMGIRLAGSRSYYIQAVGAQSGGRDCLSIGVQLPTGVMVRPITRHFLTRSPLGPGGKFQMTPTLAAAQQADIQATSSGGMLGAGGNWGVVPGVSGGLAGGVGDLGGPHGLDTAALTFGSNIAQQAGYLSAGGIGNLGAMGGYGTGGVGAVAGQVGQITGGYAGDNGILRSGGHSDGGGITAPLLHAPVGGATIPAATMGGVGVGGATMGGIGVGGVTIGGVGGSGTAFGGVGNGGIGVTGQTVGGATGSKPGPEDIELASSIAKLGETVSGLAAKVDDKQKAIERAKETAMVGATLSKLNKAIESITTRMDTTAQMAAAVAGRPAGLGGGSLPAVNVVAAPGSPLGGVSGVSSGAPGGLLGSAGPDTVPVSPDHGLAPDPVGGKGVPNSVAEKTSGATSPELEKLETTMSNLAEKIDSVAEKVGVDGSDDESATPAEQLKKLAGGDSSGSKQLTEINNAVGKLNGEMAAMKVAEQVAENVKNSDGNKDRLGDALKVLMQLQKSQAPPLQQVVNGYTQSVRAVTNPEAPSDTGTAAAIIATATVNQALNAIKNAAKATGLSGTALGTAIASESLGPKSGPDGAMSQLTKLMKAASLADKPANVLDKADKSKDKDDDADDDDSEDDGKGSNGGGGGPGGGGPGGGGPGGGGPGGSGPGGDGPGGGGGGPEGGGPGGGGPGGGGYFGGLNNGFGAFTPGPGTGVIGSILGGILGGPAVANPVGAATLSQGGPLSLSPMAGPLAPAYGAGLAAGLGGGPGALPPHSPVDIHSNHDLPPGLTGMLGVSGLMNGGMGGMFGQGNGQGAFGDHEGFGNQEGFNNHGGYSNHDQLQNLGPGFGLGWLNPVMAGSTRSLAPESLKPNDNLLNILRKAGYNALPVNSLSDVLKNAQHAALIPVNGLKQTLTNSENQIKIAGQSGNGLIRVLNKVGNALTPLSKSDADSLSKENLAKIVELQRVNALMSRPSKIDDSKDNMNVLQEFLKSEESKEKNIPENPFTLANLSPVNTVSSTQNAMTRHVNKLPFDINLAEILSPENIAAYIQSLQVKKELPANHMPSNFAKLLTDAHADDLLHSLEQPVQSVSPVPVASQSNALVDLLSRLPASSITGMFSDASAFLGKRGKVFGFRNLTSLQKNHLKQEFLKKLSVLPSKSPAMGDMKKRSFKHPSKKSKNHRLSHLRKEKPHTEVEQLDKEKKSSEAQSHRSTNDTSVRHLIHTDSPVNASDSQSYVAMEMNKRTSTGMEKNYSSGDTKRQDIPHGRHHNIIPVFMRGYASEIAAKRTANNSMVKQHHPKKKRHYHLLAPASERSLERDEEEYWNHYDRQTHREAMTKAKHEDRMDKQMEVATDKVLTDDLRKEMDWDYEYMRGRRKKKKRFHGAKNKNHLQQKNALNKKSEQYSWDDEDEDKAWKQAYEVQSHRADQSLQDQENEDRKKEHEDEMRLNNYLNGSRQQDYSYFRANNNTGAQLSVKKSSPGRLATRKLLNQRRPLHAGHPIFERNNTQESATKRDRGYWHNPEHLHSDKEITEYEHKKAAQQKRERHRHLLQEEAADQLLDNMEDALIDRGIEQEMQENEDGYYKHRRYKKRKNQTYELGHRRYEDVHHDEEHMHNASFEHSLTERLLDAVLSSKIGPPVQHHDTAQTGGLMSSAYAADHTGVENLMDTAYVSGFHTGLAGGMQAPAAAPAPVIVPPQDNSAVIESMNRLTNMVASLASRSTADTGGDGGASAAALSGQLSGLGEGIGVLIKEIRDLKSQQASRGAGNSESAMIMAATVGKALQSIKQAQAAVGMSAAGYAMPSAIQPPVMMPPPPMIAPPMIAPTGLVAMGAGNAGGITNAALMGALQALKAGGGMQAAQTLGSLQPPVTQSSPYVDAIQSSFKGMGTKSAAKFMSTLANGMNQVTQKYLDQLKASTKPAKSDDDKPPHKSSSISRGDLESLFSGAKRTHINRKRRKVTKNQIKRGHVVSIDRDDLAKILKNADIGERIIQQVKTDEGKTKVDATDRSANYKSSIRNASLTVSKKSDDTKTTEDKNKTADEIKDEENKELINQVLADKAQKVQFGHGLKPNKPGVTREVFWDVDGIHDGYLQGVYKNPRYPGKPDRTDVLYNFDSTTIQSDGFAQRVFGWFLPPFTGGYIFYTSCDDACDLFVSANENPTLKLKLVSQKEWSDHNQFDKFPLMQSSAIVSLQIGRSYYMEAVGSNADGPNHLSVGVQFPNGLVVRPIPGEFLNREPTATQLHGLQDMTSSNAELLTSSQLGGLGLGVADLPQQDPNLAANGDPLLSSENGMLKKKIAQTLAAGIAAGIMSGGSALLSNIQHAIASSVNSLPSDGQPVEALLQGFVGGDALSNSMKESGNVLAGGASRLNSGALDMKSSADAFKGAPVPPSADAFKNGGDMLRLGSDLMKSGAALMKDGGEVISHSGDIAKVPKFIMEDDVATRGVRFHHRHLVESPPVIIPFHVGDDLTGAASNIPGRKQVVVQKRPAAKSVNEVTSLGTIVHPKLPNDGTQYRHGVVQPMYREALRSQINKQHEEEDLKNLLLLNQAFHVITPKLSKRTAVNRKPPSSRKSRKSTIMRRHSNGNEAASLIDDVDDESESDDTSSSDVTHVLSYRNGNKLMQISSADDDDNANLYDRSKIENGNEVSGISGEFSDILATFTEHIVTKHVRNNTKSVIHEITPVVKHVLRTKTQKSTVNRTPPTQARTYFVNESSAEKNKEEFDFDDQNDRSDDDALFSDVELNVYYGDDEKVGGLAEKNVNANKFIANKASADRLIDPPVVQVELLNKTTNAQRKNGTSTTSNSYTGDDGKTKTVEFVTTTKNGKTTTKKKVTTSDAKDGGKGTAKGTDETERWTDGSLKNVGTKIDNTDKNHDNLKDVNNYNGDNNDLDISDKALNAGKYANYKKPKDDKVKYSEEDKQYAEQAEQNMKASNEKFVADMKKFKDKNYEYLDNGANKTYNIDNAINNNDEDDDKKAADDNADKNDDVDNVVSTIVENDGNNDTKGEGFKFQAVDLGVKNAQKVDVGDYVYLDDGISTIDESESSVPTITVESSPNVTISNKTSDLRNATAVSVSSDNDTTNFVDVPPLTVKYRYHMLSNVEKLAARDDSGIPNNDGGGDESSGRESVKLMNDILKPGGELTAVDLSVNEENPGDSLDEFSSGFETNDDDDVSNNGEYNKKPFMQDTGVVRKFVKNPQVKQADRGSANATRKNKPRFIHKLSMQLSRLKKRTLLKNKRNETMSRKTITKTTFANNNNSKNNNINNNNSSNNNNKKKKNNYKRKRKHSKRRARRSVKHDVIPRYARVLNGHRRNELVPKYLSVYRKYLPGAEDRSVGDVNRKYKYRRAEIAKTLEKHLVGYLQKVIYNGLKSVRLTKNGSSGDEQEFKRTITQNQKQEIANAALKAVMPIILQGLVQKAISRKLSAPKKKAPLLFSPAGLLRASNDVNIRHMAGYGQPMFTSSQSSVHNDISPLGQQLLKALIMQRFSNQGVDVPALTSFLKPDAAVNPPVELPPVASIGPDPPPAPTTPPPPPPTTSAKKAEPQQRSMTSPIDGKKTTKTTKKAPGLFKHLNSRHLTPTVTQIKSLLKFDSAGNSVDLTDGEARGIEKASKNGMVIVPFGSNSMVESVPTAAMKKQFGVSKLQS